ncbi:MAG: hypothetical protein E7242_06220 [Lachnospiraceae bacterium]|nr:hypothetical protein [Lachnospiraceae bacterium]
MTKILKKSSTALAVLLAALMIVTLIPVKTFAQSDVVSITSEFLQAARDYATTNPREIYQGVVEYCPLEGVEGSGMFLFYGPGEFRLDEDISLSKEVFRLCNNSDTEAFTFNLNGHSLTLTEDHVYADDAYELVASYTGKIIITGNGSLNVADTCQGEALFNTTDYLYIENGTFNGEVGSNWAHTININGGVFNDIVKFDGDAVISGGTFNDEIIAESTGNVQISGGIFKDELTLRRNANISGGTFNEVVNVTRTATISGGTFNKSLSFNASEISGGVFNHILTLNGTSHITNGDFSEVDTRGDVTIDGGNFQRLECETRWDATQLANVVINGGNFILNDDELVTPVNPTIEIGDVNATINNANVVWDLTGAAAMGNAIELNCYEEGSLTINGGTFVGGTNGHGIWVNGNASSLTVNGGEFTGPLGGMVVALNDIDLPNIVLNRGIFKVDGTVSDKNEAAIYIVGPKGLASEDANKYFNSMLGKDSEYTPALEITTFAEEGYAQDAFFSQDKLAVMPKSNVSPETEDTLATEFNNLIGKILAGESVEGIDAGLAAEILDAIAEGKAVDVGVAITPKSAEELGEDANKIEGAVTNKQKIGAFFDINIEVSIDGEVRGYITKLDNGILLKLPLINGIGDVPGGYSRTFKVARVHNGELAMLDAERENDSVKTFSDRYSTYAIVYEDARNVTPQTADNATPVVYITVFALELVGVGIVIYSKKYKEE